MQVNSNQTSTILYNTYSDMKSQQGQEFISNNRAQRSLELPQNNRLATEKSVQVTLSGGVPTQRSEVLTYDFAVRASAATATMTPTANTTQSSAQANASQDPVALNQVQGEQLPQTQATGATQNTDNQDRDNQSALGSEEEQKNSELSQEPDLEDPRVQSEIAQLKQREQEVITHENAHKSVGGQYAGAASYDYTTGPDNKRYIESGEVSIHTPSTNDPEEAKRINETVRKAALAPANPSGQDLAVAASASQKIAQAEAEIARNKAEEAAKAREEQQATQKNEMNLESDMSARKTNPAAPFEGSNRVSDLNYVRAKQVNATNAYTSISNFNRPSSNSRSFHVIG